VLVCSAAGSCLVPCGLTEAAAAGGHYGSSRMRLKATAAGSLT
jgi:hypothetical protein